MKSLKSLHEKEKIYWTKDQNLLTIVDPKTNSLFYGMIPRTNSYILLKYLSLYSYWRPRFGLRDNVLHNMVFKTKIEHLKTVVSLDNNARNISCEDGTDKMSPFHFGTITFVIFRLKIASKVSKLSVFIYHLQNYFAISTYIYMVIELWSNMNRSYTAKIHYIFCSYRSKYIYIYIYIHIYILYIIYNIIYIIYIIYIYIILYIYISNEYKKYKKPFQKLCFS